VGTFTFLVIVLAAITGFYFWRRQRREQQVSAAAFRERLRPVKPQRPAVILDGTGVWFSG
jgi:hypothetical protein